MRWTVANKTKNKQPLFVIMVMIITFLIIFDLIAVHFKGGLVSFFNLKSLSDDASSENFTLNINEKEDTKKIMYLNEALQLTLSNEKGENITNDYDYNWLSSDQNIVNVSTNGLILARSIGVATIRVTSKKDVNLYDIMEVEVISKEAKLKLKVSEQYLIMGEVLKLDTEVGGKIALNSLIWQSNNENVITVKDGYVTAKGLGDATIRVTSSIDETYYDEITLTVRNFTSNLVAAKAIKINDLFLNKKAINLNELTMVNQGDTLIINATSDVTKDNEVYFYVTSSNVKLVSRDHYVGSFEFVAPGIASIVICSLYNQNVMTTLNVIVTSPEVLINDFTLQSKTTMSLNEVLPLVIDGDGQRLDESLLKVNISDSSVVTYENNMLIPKKVGQTQVEVSYLYDPTKNLSFELNVTDDLQSKSHLSYQDVKKNNEPYFLTMGNIHHLQVGDKITMTLSLFPLWPNKIKNIQVLSSDPNVVGVSLMIDDYEARVAIECYQEGSAKIFLVYPSLEIISDEFSFLVANSLSDFDFSIKKLDPLIVGNKYQLSLKTIGELPNNLYYLYQSSDENILTIGPSGEILALEEGMVEISVTAISDQFKKHHVCNVLVQKDYLIYDISEYLSYETYLKINNQNKAINFEENFLNVYQKAYLKINVLPDKHSLNNIEVRSSDEKVLSVTKNKDEYELFALKAGTVNLSIINYENETLNKTIEIHLFDVLPKYFLPILESGHLYLDEKISLQFYVDEKATSYQPSFYFTKDIAKMVNQQIIPLKTGQTILIIKLNNDNTAYKLSIPLTITTRKIVNIFSFELKELITFVLLQIILYLILGYLIQKLKPKHLFTKLILIILPIILTSLNFLRNTTILLIFLIITVNLICFSLGYVMSRPITKKSKKGELDEL